MHPSSHGQNSWNIYGQVLQKKTLGHEISFFILKWMNTCTYTSLKIYLNSLEIKHFSFCELFFYLWFYASEPYASPSHNFCFKVPLITWLYNLWNFHYIYIYIYLILCIHESSPYLKLICFRQLGNLLLILHKSTNWEKQISEGPWIHKAVLNKKVVRHFLKGENDQKIHLFNKNNNKK